MADKAARQNFEEASDEAREALKHREPGVSASAVCRDIERRRYLLPGALNPDTLHGGGATSKLGASATVSAKGTKNGTDDGGAAGVKLTLTVPSSWRAGDTLTFDYGGVEYNVTAPAGTRPGSTMLVRTGRADQP